MADDSEIKIQIKAIASGFDNATKQLLAFKNSATAAFQSTAQELVKAQEAATKEDQQRTAASMKWVSQLKEQKAAEVSLADAKKSGAMKFTSDMEAQKLRELTKAQTDAIKENKALDAAQRKTEESARKLADTQGKLRQGYLQTSPAVQKVMDNLDAMRGQFLAAGAIIAGFTVIVKKAFQFAEEGAQIQRLEESGAALAKSFGVNLAEAARAIKAASLGTITTQQAMLQTNRALLLGVAGDTETLAKLMQIAALRGRALGLDTSDAFDRIVLGIGRVSTRILDDIGIVINGQKAYDDYAKSIGISVDNLSDQQKRVALTNAIIEDGNKLLQAAGGLLDDNASAWTRLSVNVQDALNDLKKLFADGLTPVIIALNKIFFFIPELNAEMDKHASDVLKTSKNYQEYSDELDRAAKVVGRFVDAQGRLMTVNNSLGRNIEEIVDATYRIGPAEYAAMKASEARIAMLKDRQAADRAALATQEALTKALVEFKDTMDSMTELSTDFGFDEAAKSAYDFAQAMAELEGVTKEEQESLDQLAIQLGLMDGVFLKFREEMKKAAEEGGISAEELRKAWAPIGFMKLDAIRVDFELDTDKIKQKFKDLADEIDKDFGEQQAKNRLDLSRKLSDIDQDEGDRLSDLQENILEKRGDIAKDHSRRLQGIEIDHQRQIRQIMQRFELSRMKALIDLNGRALFEAESQRDADISNAEDSAKEKRKDEQDNYDDALDDLKDYEQKQKDQIARDEERKRQDAKVAFDRQRADTKAAYEQKRADASADRQKALTELNAAYRKEKADILAQLELINTGNRKKLNERAQDFLDYISSSQAILEALASGSITIEKLRSDFLLSGGIPFGGIPYVPPVPVKTSCPVGCYWNGVQCVDNKTDKPCGTKEQSLFQSTGDMGSSTTNVKVTLDVRGDGLLAQAVRTAALDAIVDVIRD